MYRRHRRWRTPGPKPLELTVRERLAIRGFYANPRQRQATVAIAFGLTPAELTRALRLNAGLELFDYLMRHYAPEDLLPDFEVTGPGCIPPVLLRVPERLLRDETPLPLPPVATLQELGYGPREPEDDTDA